MAIKATLFGAGAFFCGFLLALVFILCMFYLSHSDKYGPINFSFSLPSCSCKKRKHSTFYQVPKMKLPEINFHLEPLRNETCNHRSFDLKNENEYTENDLDIPVSFVEAPKGLSFSASGINNCRNRSPDDCESSTNVNSRLSEPETDQSRVYSIVKDSFVYSGNSEVKINRLSNFPKDASRRFSEQAVSDIDQADAKNLFSTRKFSVSNNNDEFYKITGQKLHSEKQHEYATESQNEIDVISRSNSEQASNGYNSSHLESSTNESQFKFDLSCATSEHRYETKWKPPNNLTKRPVTFYEQKNFLRRKKLSSNEINMGDTSIDFRNPLTLYETKFGPI